MWTQSYRILQPRFVTTPLLQLLVHILHMRRLGILLYKGHKDRRGPWERTVAQENMAERDVQGKTEVLGHKGIEETVVVKVLVGRRESGASKDPRGAKEILDVTVHRGCVENEGFRD